jgi:hypothetical protein
MEKARMQRWCANCKFMIRVEKGNGCKLIHGLHASPERNPDTVRWWRDNADEETTLIDSAASGCPGFKPDRFTENHL